VGLTSQVSSEEHTNGTSSVRTKDYSYDAWGQRTGMTQTPAGGTPAQYTYAQDPHGSVSMLLDKAGTSTAQYGIQRVPAALTGTVCDGYQPYGDLDSDLSAGDESPNLPTNPYRYTGKRYDSGSKTLDMGARRFSPDTGRFLQMDTFSGALADMALGTDPLTQNRYALAGGNPISFVEVDGHNPCSTTYSAYQDQTTGTCLTASTTASTGVPAPNDGTGFDYTTADAYDPTSDHAKLDVLGAVDPTGVVDRTNAGISFAGVLLPYFGDAAKAGRVARAARFGCSFSGDTVVSTLDGEVQIEDLAVGDTVLAWDEETGETGSYEVTAVFSHEDAAIEYLQL